MKKAYAYLRVSSEEQVSNFSLDNQQDYCLREAERQEFKIVENGIYREEGVSAKTTNRPQLIRLLEDCRKNQKEVSAVFIYKIDRISRDTYDFLAIKRQLSKYGIRIISVTEPVENSPTGEFLETLLAASAKLDNATKSLRSKDGMRKRLESGWANGKAPVGYINITKDEKQIIERDSEQFEAVKKAWEEMATGIYTLDSIIPVMRKLNIRVKYKNNRLIPITKKQQTQRLFRNKFYAGYVANKDWGTDKIGNHEAMISEDLFYKVQGIIDKRSRTVGMKYNRLNESFPLRRHVICDKCGKLMTAAFSKRKYPYYYCLEKSHFSPSVPKENFEKEFIQFMTKVKPKKKFVQLFTAMVKEKWQDRYSHLINKQKGVDRELSDLYEVRKKLGQKHLQGIYSDEAFKEQLELIEDQILVKKTIKSEAKLQKIDIDILVNFMNNFLWNLDKAWTQSKDLFEKKTLVSSIFPQNIIYQYPGFRTEYLSQSFEIIKRLEGTKKSLWVAEQSRTADLMLHRHAL